MAKKIKVMLYEVGKRGRVVEIGNDLKSMQELVGGYIEVVPLEDDLVVVCDEEGILKYLPINRVMLLRGQRVPIHGTFFVTKCAFGAEEFETLKPYDIAWLEDEIK